MCPDEMAVSTDQLTLGNLGQNAVSASMVPIKSGDVVFLVPQVVPLHDVPGIGDQAVRTGSHVFQSAIPFDILNVVGEKVRGHSLPSTRCETVVQGVSGGMALFAFAKVADFFGGVWVKVRQRLELTALAASLHPLIM